MSEEATLSEAVTQAAVAPEATEAKPAAEPVTKVEDTFSPKFAALARKEKEAIRKLQAAKEIEAKYAAREKELSALESRYKELDELLVKNPLEALKRKGLSYQDLTNLVLNEGKLTPEVEVKTMKEQMNEWMKAQEEKEAKKAEEEKLAAEQEYNQAIENFKMQVGEFLTSNKDTYELINLYQANELVFSTIEEHFNKTQKVMSNKEASDLVEKYLEDQVEMAAKAKKLAGRFVPKGEEKKEPAKEAPKTLANSVTTSSAPSLLPAKQENDRIRRALAALEKQG